MGERIDGHETWRDLLRFRPRVFVVPAIVAIILIDSLLLYLQERDEVAEGDSDVGWFLLGVVISVLVGVSVVAWLWRLQGQYDRKLHLRYRLGVSEANLCINGFLGRCGGAREKLVFPEGHEHLLMADESYEVAVGGHPVLVEIYGIGDELEVFVGPVPREGGDWFDGFVKDLDGALDDCRKGT